MVLRALGVLPGAFQVSRRIKLSNKLKLKGHTMSEFPEGTSSVARQRPHRGRVTRVAFAAMGAAALVLAAAVPASATPAAEAPLVNSATGATEEGVFEFLGFPATSGGLMASSTSDVDLRTAGIPSVTEAGAPFSVTLTAENTLLGAAQPTGTVALVTLTDADPGYQLLGTQELVGGTAEIVLRPFGIGLQSVIAVYSGDDAHNPAVVFEAPIEVTSVATNVDVSIDSASPAYGGGNLGVWVTAESICVAQAIDPAVQEMCNATYGIPLGEVTLKMDGAIVGTQAIGGTFFPGAPAWLDLDVDLTPRDASGVVRFDVAVPNRQLGTPENYMFTAEFTPTNWFSEAVSTDVAVETSAAETTTDVVLGDFETAITELVVGETVDIQAYVGVDPYWAAPAAGVVNLLLNGEILVEGLSLEADAPVALANLQFEEPGKYSLVAEFVPSSLNHTGSKSAAFDFTVTAVKPDGGDGGNITPDKKPVAKKDALASTGGDSMPLALGVGTLLLVGAGAALVLARRRSEGAQH